MHRLLLRLYGISFFASTLILVHAKQIDQKLPSGKIVGSSVAQPAKKKTVQKGVAHAKKKDLKVEVATKKDAPKKEYAVQGSEFVIDGVAAVVFGQEGTQLIAKVEVDRPSLTGQVRSLEDVVFERRVFLDALKHKIAIDDDVIDRYLAVVQRQNNLTAEEMRQVFSNAGYTYEEGREQFKILQVVNQMVDYKIRSNLIVPRKDVEKYCKENPEMEEASYDIEYTEVPFDASIPKAVQKRRLARSIKDGSCKDTVEWPGSFTIKSSEIADSRGFIRGMKKDSFYGPLELDTGFGIYHLVDKRDARERTLEERYQEIVEMLRMPRYEELLTDYRESLVKGSSVLRF